ncbi:hypothetical protein FZEAL_7700 [Fusarium zealandicum]|uniref:Uncharacterized protein n=1 Tax=Fusarium zealandicum TaxID=1053134 RepID=A0A8H4UF76_9HYPO|nr:hypothetical protein FZEAL_7700 [Fusarium zealandicum]
MVSRILRDDPSKGVMHNRQAVDIKFFGWKPLSGYDLWPMYVIGLAFLILVLAGPPGAYLTLNLRRLDTNLLTILTQFIGGITMLTLMYLCEIWNERVLMGVFAQVWLLPTLIALVTLPDAISPWAKCAVLRVLLSYPSSEIPKSLGIGRLPDVKVAHAMQVGWCNRSSNTVRTRAVSAGLYK